MNNKLIEKLNELISKHQVIAEQLKDEMIYQDHELNQDNYQNFPMIVVDVYMIFSFYS